MFTLLRHGLETAIEGSQSSLPENKTSVEENQDVPDNGQHQHE